MHPTLTAAWKRHRRAALPPLLGFYTGKRPHQALEFWTPRSVYEAG